MFLTLIFKQKVRNNFLRGCLLYKIMGFTVTFSYMYIMYFDHIHTHTPRIEHFRSTE
jgi:hypothetical protein